MNGFFITFEGTEGSGKSTQVEILLGRLQSLGRPVRKVREPGGTSIGEEIRHTLKHSEANRAMTPEAELLLMNASRAQLVREVIRPALRQGEIVLCDRFYHSTIAYQGYGRQLDLARVQGVIKFAVGETLPDLTLLLQVPLGISEDRRSSRRATGGSENLMAPEPARDRMEEADRSFFERVEQGFEAIARAEPDRVRRVDANRPVDRVSEEIWGHVQKLIG